MSNTHKKIDEDKLQDLAAEYIIECESNKKEQANVKAPVNGKPHRRSSAVRLAKQHLGYTPSLRPLGETCNTCAYRVNRVCIIGGFVTKVNSGCDEWVSITDVSPT